VVEELTLKAEPREGTGKGVGRKLRARARIPAVVYGLSKPNRNVSVESHALEHLINVAGIHAMISLRIGDGNDIEHVVLRDIQRDPVTDRLLHADFHRIDPTKPIYIEVPVEPTGVAIGVKQGGILEQQMREIEIKCLPGNLPSSIPVDVSQLQIGHSLHAGEITPPEGIEILTSPDTVLFTVIAPRKAEEVAVAVAEEVEEAEPEVLTKKETKEKEEAEEEGKEKE